MDGIVKIVLAIKLKFLLIILSMGVTYFIEHKAIKKTDPIPAVERVSPASVKNDAGDAHTGSLSRVAEDSNTLHTVSGNQSPVQPVNYVTNRPFTTRGLEIYIVL